MGLDGSLGGVISENWMYVATLSLIVNFGQDTILGAILWPNIWQLWKSGSLNCCWQNGFWWVGWHLRKRLPCCHWFNRPLRGSSVKHCDNFMSLGVKPEDDSLEKPKVHFPKSFLTKLSVSYIGKQPWKNRQTDNQDCVKTVLKWMAEKCKSFHPKTEEGGWWFGSSWLHRHR